MSATSQNPKITGTPETPKTEDQSELHKKKGYAVYIHQDSVSPLHKELVIASIRLEYLKLAIIVVLVMIVVWYVYSRINKINTGEHMYTRRMQGTRAPTGAQSTVPFQSGWYSGQSNNRNGIARPLGQINNSGDDKEDFAPYASWLVPDIYRSDPSHDDHLASKSHYGMYAPYDLDYIFPDNIEPPANRGTTINANGTRSKEPNVRIPYGSGPPEHMIDYNQHKLNPDDVASEVDVPERQLEGEAGLLFGLTNLITTPVADGGTL